MVARMRDCSTLRIVRVRVVRPNEQCWHVRVVLCSARGRGEQRARRAAQALPAAAAARAHPRAARVARARRRAAALRRYTSPRTWGRQWPKLLFIH